MPCGRGRCARRAAFPARPDLRWIRFGGACAVPGVGALLRGGRSPARGTVGGRVLRNSGVRTTDAVVVGAWLAVTVSAYRAPSAASPAQRGDDDLAFAGVGRLAELLRAGEVSPRELVEFYLERIARLDPALNAFRVVYGERALEEADVAAGRLRDGDQAPLLGVPVAVKDQCDVAGDVTLYGTGLIGEPAVEDCEAVRRLRLAGAIPIGKTHMCELALWPFTESAAWGITRNPWRLDRTPGGSSGGSAAAVAGGLAAGAVGGDGGGSIRTPAGCCGVVGIKPQRGRVSLAPLEHDWYGLAVLGPIGRSVLDAALLLDAMSGSDRAPASTFADAARRAPGRLRIGVSREPPRGVRATVEPEVVSAVSETAELLRSLGHEVHEAAPDLGYGIAIDFLARYLRAAFEEVSTVPYPRLLERRTREMARLGRLIRPSVMDRIQAHTPALAARANTVFEQVDVLLTPTFTAPAIEVNRWQGRGALRTILGSGEWVPFCQAWNITGQPAVAIPAGHTTDGLPLSVQLVGRAGDEETLISIASQLEAERPWTHLRPPVRPA